MMVTLGRYKAILLLIKRYFESPITRLRPKINEMCPILLRTSLKKM